MHKQQKIYLAIDLKSFYASVECAVRGLDAMRTNLVVADPGRTEKTICLAVSPSLKSYGIPGRPRLFEVMQRVREVNDARKYRAPRRTLTGKSCDAAELAQNPALAVDYIVAPPQMARYMRISTQIYKTYLKYIAPEDIHVYSIDEVFIDATAYLDTYRLTPRELTMRLIRDVLQETGITATAGIGTNLYLCKIAMDIVAKRMPADADGVRIAALDEASYRRLLWSHRPLTDFWRVGRGYAKKLEAKGLYTMGDIAACSLQHEALLYKLFGVNAELLIDHAWGWEPCTIADIKAYRPESSSISTGQVLQEPYTAEQGRLIVREMTELLVLDLVEKGLVAEQMVLTVGYDISGIPDAYSGPLTTDHYGRKLPKAAHGSVNLAEKTASTKQILAAVLGLYDRIVDGDLLVRRMYVVANRVTDERAAAAESTPAQLDLFTNYEAQVARRKREAAALARERSMQRAMLQIKKKYGKNAILKGMNLQEGATTIQRNGQVGGHKA